MFNFNDKEQLAKDLHTIISRVRERRQTTEQRWLEIHSAWRATKTKSFFKSQMFNHYVPYFGRSIERFTKRAAQMVLPSTEYFEVKPGDEISAQAGKRAESVHNYMLYLMRKRIRIYSLTKQLFRTWGLYGRAIVKPSIRVENGKVWPGARAVDPFMFLYWPETVSNIDDARVVVEDSFLAIEQYNALAAKVHADPILKENLNSPTWPTHITQRLNEGGLSEPSEVPSDEKGNGSSWVYLSEVWVNAGPHWRMVWVVWNLRGGPKVVHVPDRKYARPQYRVANDREIPGEQQTTSMGDDQEWMQTLLNDQINMMLEGQAIGMAPPTAVDPNLIARADSLIWGPRRKWLVPPDGVKQLQTVDTTKLGIQSVHFTMGLMDLFSGSSPLAEGGTVRNMPRAGFAVSSLLSMSLSDIRDAARTVEDDILTPLLKDLHDLTVQFVPPTQVISIPGTQDFKVQNLTLSDLEGNYDLTWTGSIESQETQQRADQLMKLFTAMGRNGEIIIADMRSRGLRINWSALFKRWWRDGVGERGADSIIETVTEDDNQAGMNEMEQIRQYMAQMQGAQNA